MKLNLEIIISSIKETFFKNSYTLNLREVFVKNNEKKSSGLENNVNWFLEKLKLSNSENEKFYKTHFIKWSIYYVDYGINIGSEINGNRPSLMLKKTPKSFGEDVIVIPLTSFKETNFTDEFDILVKKSKDNRLKNESILKIRQIRTVSKKRIGNFVGFINDEEIRKQVNENLTKILGIK